jgi:hypothetical protein
VTNVQFRLAALATLGHGLAQTSRFRSARFSLTELPPMMLSDAGLLQVQEQRRTGLIRSRRPELQGLRQPPPLR